MQLWGSTTDSFATVRWRMLHSDDAARYAAWFVAREFDSPLTQYLPPFADSEVQAAFTRVAGPQTYHNRHLDFGADIVVPSAAVPSMVREMRERESHNTLVAVLSSVASPDGVRSRQSCMADAALVPNFPALYSGAEVYYE